MSIRDTTTQPIPPEPPSTISKVRDGGCNSEDVSASLRELKLHTEKHSSTAEEKRKNILLIISRKICTHCEF